MELSTTVVALLMQGLPYLALMVFSARQFVRHPDASRLHSLLTFAAAAGAFLLAAAGSSILSVTNQEGQAVLFLRLSLVCLLLAVYALFLLANDLLFRPRWLIWSATVLFLGGSFIALFAPTTLAFIPRPVVVLHPLTFESLVLLLLIGGSAATTLLFWYQSTAALGATRRRLQLIGAALLLLCFAIILMSGSALFWGDLVLPLWATRTLILLAGATFYLGFIPPRWLRRLWLRPELDYLNQLANALLLSPNPEHTLEEMMQRTLRLLDAQTGIIQRWNTAQDSLDAVACYANQTRPPTSEYQRFKDAALAEAFDQRQALILPLDPTRPARRWGRSSSETLLAAPLLAEGRALGVLGFHCLRLPLFSEDHLTLLQRIANQITPGLLSQEQTATIARLHQEQRLKDDFIAVMTHELRSPLTVLKGRLQLLKRQAAKGELIVGSESLARFETQVARLDTLITLLIDVTYLDAGRLHLLRHPTDLSSFIRDSIERNQHLHSSHPLVFELVHASAHDAGQAGGPQPLMALTDHNRLHQVISALFKFIHQAAPTNSLITVQVDRQHDQNEALVSIHYEGDGISAEEQAHLFARWPQGGPAALPQPGEMSLELFISAQFIKLHGGRLWVESSGEVGKGATFFFSLPLIRPDEIPSADPGIPAAPPTL